MWPFKKQEKLSNKPNEPDILFSQKDINETKEAIKAEEDKQIEIEKSIKQKQKNCTNHQYKYSHTLNYISSETIPHNHEAVLVCALCGTATSMNTEIYQKC